MTENPFPYNYICIEGSIGAGKTSFCKLLHEQFNCRMILEEFDDNPFLPFFYEDPDRFAFTVELFFMTERHKQLQRNLISQDLFSSFTISDYIFIKTLLFARKNLSEEEYRLFQKMFNVLNASFPTPDIIVYFHRSVENLMKFIRKRGRSYESNITEEYLVNVQNSYFEYFKNITSFPVLILDLNDIDFVMQDSHYKTVLSLIKKEYRPGVHQVKISI